LQIAKHFSIVDSRAQLRFTCFMLDWHEYIHTDPKILVGKPVIKGTRLSVDFVLRLLANGWTREQVFENYPRLTPEALQACFSFAAECLEEESFYAAPAR